MSDKRSTDREKRTWYRADRFFQLEGKWYFYTREGDMEGPFADKVQAQQRLKTYVDIMSSSMGYMAEEAPDWDLAPMPSKADKS